jgi:hypothetical protein
VRAQQQQPAPAPSDTTAKTVVAPKFIAAPKAKVAAPADVMIAPMPLVAPNAAVRKVAAPGGMAVAVAANNAARANTMKARYEQQFRPFYLARLIHARTICHLSKDQLRKLRPEADQAFDAFVAHLVQNPLVLRVARPQNFVNVAGQRSVPETPDPEIDLERAIAAVVKKHVSAELWTAYEADLQRRREARRDAGVRFLMMVLDDDLLLSTEQHDKLARALTSHWQNSWSSIMNLTYNGNAILPDIPDTVVKPVLDTAQYNNWQSKTRYGGFYSGGAVLMPDNRQLDEELGGDPKKRPAAANLPAGMIVPAPAIMIEVARPRAVEFKKAEPKPAGAKAP